MSASAARSGRGSSPTGAAKIGADGRLVVGVADLLVVQDPTARIITYALGSCIGVTLWDPIAKVGGLLHLMLPSSKTNAEKAEANPAMFADTGVPKLFRRAYELGADKKRLVVTAAGGAEVIQGDGHFKIGSRNRTAIRKLFWKNGVLLAADDTGGTISRTMSLDVATGTVTVRNAGKETVLWQA